jgi:Family of unknown function (DUF6113)
MDIAPDRKGTHWLVTGAVYIVLFLLGGSQGLIGSFQYSHVVGSVPVVALACCAVLLASCLLAAWAMRSVSGALVTAAGWLVASFLMAMPVPSGSLVITGTSPGEWYLYGGTICALLGVGFSFGSWVRGTGARLR